MTYAYLPLAVPQPPDAPPVPQGPAATACPDCGADRAYDVGDCPFCGSKEACGAQAPDRSNA